MALLAGFVFALGLGISGMTQPARVIAFLDLAGDWDPSLALVMIGAVGAHFAFAQRAKRAARPRFASAFDVPGVRSVDRSLLWGAALFGLGWGASGFCPGPAVVSLVRLAPDVLAFVLTMLLGMQAVDLLRRRAAPGSSSRA